MDLKKLTGWKEKLQWLGRTADCGNKVYFNWTNAGFRLKYTGTCLIADLEAICSIEEGTDTDTGNGGRENWPCAAVFLDDDQEPERIFEVRKPKEKCLLFSADQVETHRITVRKITENNAGKLAISDMTGDGRISLYEEKGKKLKIEFIGDSITCGFGNLTEERERGFFPQDENGWLTYGAEAGRLLDAETTMISCSGITLADAPDKKIWPHPGMAHIYEYTDWFLEEKLGRNEKTKWDFRAHPKDMIVINLGTNDSVMMDVCCGKENTELFEHTYMEFLSFLRKVYGAGTWILCTLGPMDYFLYDNICCMVEKYRKETGDEKVGCFKFMKVRFSEGIGACAHPTLATHLRMGRELAEHIRRRILWQLEK